VVEHLYVCFWRYSPRWASPSSFTRFLDHTQWRTTVGRTLLDEWSARRRDLYLTTLSTHNLSRRAVADLRLRPRGHWKRCGWTIWNMNLASVMYKNQFLFPRKHYLPSADTRFLRLWKKARNFFFLAWPNSPSGPGPPHYRGFTITLGRSLLDEWSARHRDMYMTKRNTHNRQTPTSQAVFEPTAAADPRFRLGGHWDERILTLLMTKLYPGQRMDILPIWWRNSRVGKHERKRLFGRSGRRYDNINFFNAIYPVVFYDKYRLLTVNKHNQFIVIL
jgi:hypothetical protein